PGDLHMAFRTRAPAHHGARDGTLGVSVELTLSRILPVHDRLHYSHRIMAHSIVARMLVLVVALGLLAVPAVSPAPAAARVYRVGVLAMGSRTPDGRPAAALREGLQELGYVEGKNIVYEARFAEGRADRLPALAAELVSLRVDVIVTQGGPPTPAAKAATSTIP